MTRPPRRWAARTALAGTAATAVVAAGLVPAATAEEVPGNLISNGTFDSGIAPWIQYGASEPYLQDGAACIDVPEGLANPWDAALLYNHFSVEPGADYSLSFRAWASVDGVAPKANVGVDEAPYPGIGGENVTLSTEPQDFDIDFNGGEFDTDRGQVAFQVGGQGAYTLCVDDVLLTTSAGPTELLTNGDFSAGLEGWNVNPSAEVVDGAACLTVPAGTGQYQAGISRLVPMVAGERYRLSYTAWIADGTPAAFRTIIQGNETNNYLPFLPAKAPELTGEPQEFGWTFESPADMENADFQLFQHMASTDAPYTVCFDDVSLVSGAPEEPYQPDTGPAVKVNQVGYLPGAPKHATYVTDEAAGLPWELRSSAGAVVASGTTQPQGEDWSSELSTHLIDFSNVRTPGDGYTLHVGEDTSFPFAISSTIYQDLATDAGSYYYPARSGIEILGEVAGEEYARPAGHLGEPGGDSVNEGDYDVPCVGPDDATQLEYGEGNQFLCPEGYTLDVIGGWYDAGDHGKYVVNGGISVAQLMATWERELRLSGDKGDDLRDGSLRVVEQGNGVPDILDEARWELEWMLRMQVPAGTEMQINGEWVDAGGLVHHKIADADWTGIPLMPHDDPQPRILHRPSTAATLNVAAVAAQGARLFEQYDADFAAELLTASRTAYAAAQAHPEVYAPAPDAAVNPNPGSGPYNDTDLSDEWYWAAGELLITTNEKTFADDVRATPWHLAQPAAVFRLAQSAAFDWGNVAGFARLQLALNDTRLSASEELRYKRSVVVAANKLMQMQDEQAFGQVYAPESGTFDWGSNHLHVQNMIVAATAYELTHQGIYLKVVLEGMDYLLGRNALAQSYITGYGEKFSQNQHSRWWANQANPALPNPPVGAFSGGPNSAIQDPVAQSLLQGCAPQFCYIDDIESWSTNEITVNWNAPLTYIGAFLADYPSGVK